MIYELALTKDTPIEPYLNTGDPKKNELGLLRTCRQINQEATKIFWSRNAFAFHTQPNDQISFGSWLREIHDRPGDLQASITRLTADIFIPHSCVETVTAYDPLDLDELHILSNVATVRIEAKMYRHAKPRCCIQCVSTDFWRDVLMRAVMEELGHNHLMDVKIEITPV